MTFDEVVGFCNLCECEMSYKQMKAWRYSNLTSFRTDENLVPLTNRRCNLMRNHKTRLAHEIIRISGISLKAITKLGMKHKRLLGCSVWKTSPLGICYKSSQDFQRGDEE